MLTIIGLVAALLALTVFVNTIIYLIDFFAHVSRYRNYIKDYPSTRLIKARVWKFTK